MKNKPFLIGLAVGAAALFLAARVFPSKVGNAVVPAQETPWYKFW